MIVKHKVRPGLTVYAEIPGDPFDDLRRMSDEIIALDRKRKLSLQEISRQVTLITDRRDLLKNFPLPEGVTYEEAGERVRALSEAMNAGA